MNDCKKNLTYLLVTHVFYTN